MSKFPHRKTDDNAVENAQQVLKQRYYETVRSYADEVLKAAVREGYDDLDEAREHIDDAVHQLVDGSSEVIYTHRALNTLVQSDNWLAIDDVGLEGVTNDGISRVFTLAAYYALRQDVSEMVEAKAEDYFEDDA